YTTGTHTADGEATSGGSGVSTERYVGDMSETRQEPMSGKPRPTRFRRSGLQGDIYDRRASTAARARNAVSTSLSDTGAGTVHWPRCIVGTRIAATAPSGPRLTTAVAASSGPWFALITSVHVPSCPQVWRSAYTPSRPVGANSSFTERRSPFTIPSAVPVTINPIAVP